MKIALFPGHVGKDTGAIDDGSDGLRSVEAAITAPVTNQASQLLTLMGYDNQVYSGSLSARIAMSQQCDMGVSLHADICTDQNVHGYHVIYYPRSVKGRLLAEYLDKSLEISFDRARKIHSRTNLAILRDTPFPCALVEMGFMSNPIDEAELMEPHYQYRLAFAIADGIRMFLSNV